MEISLPWAEFISFWANWTLVGALIVGVIATYGIVVSGNIKENALKATTASLEKEAADARLETERVKAVVAWRTISLEASAALEKVLAAKPGAVNLRYIDGDPEALFFAIQFSKVLDNAHWQVAPGAVKPSNAIAFGVFLPDATGDDAIRLRTAFVAAKVEFTTTVVPQSGVSFLYQQFQTLRL
jgi:hypothetical protein